MQRETFDLSSLCLVLATVQIAACGQSEQEPPQTGTAIEVAGGEEQAGAKTPPNPTRSAISSRVIEIVAEQLGAKKEEVTPAFSFVEDLGADSLDAVELIMALEEEFAIEIRDEETEGITTVQGGY